MRYRLFVAAVCTLVLEPARGELALFPVREMFAWAGDGLYPTSRLMEGKNGNLYGAMSEGGLFGCGTIYMITPLGDFNELFAFSSKDGKYPCVTLSKDGNLYGTVFRRGAPPWEGTLFRISQRGELKNLCVLGGSNGSFGSFPVPLTEGEDNALYGTMQRSNDFGTIFRATKTGELRTLHSFTGNDGGMPISALVDGGDGCLYGTSFNGGNGFAGGGGGLGTVFKLTYGGAISVLARFNGEDGRNPVGGLTLGRDRAFYGTTALGGVSNFGTVFRISRSGELSTLASFSGTNGAMPHGGLAMGPDGSFYGITAYRGKMGSSYGSIFRVTTNGVLTTLVALDGVMARNPWGEMTLTSKGEWWGVMFDLMKRSGDGNGGLIFKLVDSKSVPRAPNIARKPTSVAFTNGVFHLSGAKH